MNISDHNQIIASNSQQSYVFYFNIKSDKSTIYGQIPFDSYI